MTNKLHNGTGWILISCGKGLATCRLTTRTSEAIEIIKMIIQFNTKTDTYVINLSCSYRLAILNLFSCCNGKYVFKVDLSYTTILVKACVVENS